MTTKVFIDGEAGTTGLQIRERLASRDDLTMLTVAPDKRKDLAERKRLLNAADIAILCLPDAAALESVALIDNDTTRVIDASTAYRVADGWTYGFAEMTREQSAQIAQARRLSNPGCWPQGVIAMMRPLIDAGLLPANLPITVHGVSGYSGGGRQMIESYEAAGTKPNQFAPYGLTLAHKHLPEMQTFGRLETRPLFVPAVGNFRQGMTVVVALQLAGLPRIPRFGELHAALAAHYAAIDKGFVDVAPLGTSNPIDAQACNGTNRMQLRVAGNDETAQAVLIAIYDNLGKGASGAAVQNLNLMTGAYPGLSLQA